MNGNDIKKYLVNGKLAWLVDTYKNDNELAEVLYERLKSNYNYNGNHDKAIEAIKESVKEYRLNNGNIEKIVDGLCSNLENIVSPSSNLNVTQNSSYTSSNNRTSSGTKNINVDTDTIEETIKENKNIQEEKALNKIETDGYVSEVFGEYNDIIEKSEQEIEKILEQIGIETINSMERIQMLDSNTADVMRGEGANFNDILDVLSLYKQTGSTIKLADKDFFMQSSNAKITEYKNDSGEIKYRITCDGYTYDTGNRRLTDSKGNNIKVNFYVPTNISDISKLNTVTALCGADEKSVEEYDGIKKVMSNSILIVPSKQDPNDSFTKYSGGIAASTMFMNKVTNQQSGCHNIITGCSAGGSTALKVAATNGDLYDTIICINNALLVTGLNAKEGVKEQFASIDDLKGLDGKNIFFIQTKDDPNLNHCATDSSGWVECDSVRQSYLYKGIEIATKNLPNAQIFLITNSDFNGFNNIDNSNNNFHYSESFWEQIFGNKNYAAHAQYKNVLVDLLNHGIFV